MIKELKCVVMCCVMLLLYDSDKGVNKAILEGFDMCDVCVYGRGGERTKERCLMRWVMGCVMLLCYMYVMWLDCCGRYGYRWEKERI